MADDGDILPSFGGVEVPLACQAPTRKRADRQAPSEDTVIEPNGSPALHGGKSAMKFHYIAIVHVLFYAHQKHDMLVLFFIHFSLLFHAPSIYPFFYPFPSFPYFDLGYWPHDNYPSPLLPSTTSPSKQC